MSLRSPGVVCALVLAGAWLAAWVALLGFLPGKQLAGVPLITWSQIALGALAVVVSVVLIFRLEAFERRQQPGATGGRTGPTGHNGEAREAR